MSYITKRNQVKICPNPGLAITWCGWQKCHPDHDCGPIIYKDYAMTFILDGHGRYSTNGKTYELNKNVTAILCMGVDRNELKEGETLTEADVKKFVLDHMAKHKVPKFVDFVEAFPMNAAGKILKYKMREDAVKKYNLSKADKIETA